MISIHFRRSYSSGALRYHVNLEVDGVVRMSSSLQTLRFHGPYLRDNCPCAACRHPETQQRTGPVHRASIVPASASWAPAPDASARGRVRVVWPDAHESEFDVAWLERYAYWREAAAAGGAEISGAGVCGAGAEADEWFPRHELVLDFPDVVGAFERSLRGGAR